MAILAFVLLHLSRVSPAREILLQKWMAHCLDQNKLATSHFMNHIAMKIVRAS